jgi:hypothetical protein
MSSEVNTNDLLVIGLNELLATGFGISSPTGNAQINSFKGPLVSSKQLHITGDARILGVVQSGLTLGKPILLPKGSSSVPALAFAGDPDTGFHNPASGVIEFISDGVPVFTIDSSGASAITSQTTPGGGATVQHLTSVATTTSAITPILSIPPSASGNKAYIGEAAIIAVNTTNNTDIASHWFTFRAKEIGGTFTTSGQVQHTFIVDASLTLAEISVTGGGNLNVNVQGVAGTNISWTSKVVLTSQSF